MKLSYSIYFNIISYFIHNARLFERDLIFILLYFEHNGIKVFKYQNVKNELAHGRLGKKIKNMDVKTKNIIEDIFVKFNLNNRNNFSHLNFLQEEKGEFKSNNILDLCNVNKTMQDYNTRYLNGKFKTIRKRFKRYNLILTKDNVVKSDNIEFLKSKKLRLKYDIYDENFLTFFNNNMLKN